MNNLGDLKKLQEAAKGFSALYVEDNEPLRANATKLLQKFFSSLYVAADGAEGLALFKENRPAIVITDIKMPKLDGMAMSKKIMHAAPDTKIIIMSAFDEKEYLHEAIELGLFRFLKKPVNVKELSKVLYEALVQINNEREARIFQAQIGNIFNYQSSMILMMNNTKPALANQPLLDFYNVEDIAELNEKYKDIGHGFLEHDGFLYNKKEGSWLDEVLANKNKIFNVKMKDQHDGMKHFILKCQDIPDKVDYWILSFDDVTELNLLELFDKNRIDNDTPEQNTKAMFNLLEVIQRNNAKISLHNFYKGLSITNRAVISEIKENSVVLKTAYMQQKVMQHEGNTLISSEALPAAIFCDEVLNITFDKPTVEIKNLKFVQRSPMQRETVRLVPEESHQVSMFMGDNKYTGDLSILDVSLKSVKLGLSVLPAAFEPGNEVTLDMVFTLDHQPIIINTKATLFHKREANLRFELVFLFELDTKTRATFVKYITKRQMIIIREFKGLQNGQ